MEENQTPTEQTEQVEITSETSLLKNKVLIGVFLILLVFVFGLGGYLFLSKNGGENIDDTETDTFLNSEKNKLFGYYRQDAKIVNNNVLSGVCDAFVVTGGDISLRNEFIQKINQGNTLNSLDNQSNLVLNIQLDGLSDADKNIIVSSSSDQPIRLAVQKKQSRSMGVGQCYSPVYITDVGGEKIEPLWTRLDNKLGYSVTYPKNEVKVIDICNSGIGEGEPDPTIPIDNCSELQFRRNVALIYDTEHIEVNFLNHYLHGGTRFEDILDKWTKYHPQKTELFTYQAYTGRGKDDSNSSVIVEFTVVDLGENYMEIIIRAPDEAVLEYYREVASTIEIR